MGNYDMLPKGSQVKCWGCDYKTYHVGDEVYAYFPEYNVLLAEGGYVHVKEGKIVAIIEEDDKAYYPEDFAFPCIDKWGGEVKTAIDLEHANLLGGYYYHWMVAK